VAYYSDAMSNEMGRGRRIEVDMPFPEICPNRSFDRNQPKPLILAGHSHVTSLVYNTNGYDKWDQLGPNDFVLLPVNDCLAVYGVHGPGHRGNSYWDFIKSISRGAALAILWNGNQHNVDFLLKHEISFDFIPRGLEYLGYDNESVLIPEQLVMAKFSHSLVDLRSFLSSIEVRDVYLVGTPPPKKDNLFIKKAISHESIFDRRITANFEITTPLLRYKLWYTLQSLYKAMAEQFGITYINIPACVTDSDGFLHEDYYANDVTHANEKYGAIMLNEIISVVREDLACGQK
jgi:hypothetical protein